MTAIGTNVNTSKEEFINKLNDQVKTIKDELKTLKEIVEEQGKAQADIIKALNELKIEVGRIPKNQSALEAPA